MSLLIKALQKAEEEKTSDGTHSASLGGLSLEPKSSQPAGGATSRVEPVLTEPMSAPQQVAAGVFSAKLPSGSRQANDKKLLLIGAVSLLLLMLLGLYVYSYIDSLNPSTVLAPRPPITQPPASPVVASQVVSEADGANAAVVSPNEADPDKDGEVAEAKAPSQPSASEREQEKAPMIGAKMAQPPRPQEVVMGEPVAAPDEGALKITRNPVVVGVHPDLSAAYQAFNKGDDAAAQYHYRKVLQSDVRNTDALLGMAAVASRQGRTPDAAGWYAKVLEVDPRNTIAQAALASGYAQVDPIGAESRIKNMLAQKPDAAHLHAALGSVYVERGDWPQAQQAYFQAYHHAPTNADYAFNLAISLDHLGKSSLALQYYKEAQALLSQSGSGNIDQAQLDARILQLQ
ncbi:MAG TPA: tetratricopeptide repeat protein [Methylophilaceae bacterium]|nr:tetratricopeptide repeat protein [Methylophilaceae bacterium]